MGKGGGELKALTTEINEIVAAPYPVLFTTLSYILSRLDDSHVHLWTIVKACQVRTLVSRLSDGLDKDDSALPTLLRLIKNPIIRDEVIRQHPGVLRGWFENTNEESLLDAFLTLLGSPLPTDITKTECCLHFIQSVFANSRAEPNDAWIHKVQVVLPNLSLAVLSTLDHDTVHKCMSLWSEASKSTESLIFLKFASISSMLHRLSQEENGSFACDSTIMGNLVPVNHWIDRCSALFSKLKALKMLKSILLHTLHLMSNSTAVTDGMVGIFEIVRKTIAEFPRIVLDKAICDQEIVRVMTKIVQKSDAESMPLPVRLAVAGILLTLDPVCQIWDIDLLYIPFADTALDLLQPPSTDRSGLLLNTVRRLDFQRRYHDLWVLLEKKCWERPQFMQEGMQYVISRCRPALHYSIDGTIGLEVATSLVSGMERCLDVTSGRTCILASSIFEILPDWWNWTTPPISANPDHNCGGLELCPHVNERMRRQLIARISRVLLKSSCISATQISQQRFEMLFDLSNPTASMDQTAVCRWPTFIEHKILKPIHQQSSDRGPRQNDIEEALAAGLASVHEQTVDLVWKYIDEVCRDLQNRCRTIEVPLRAQQMKVENLTKDLVDARAATEVMLADHRARSLMWQHDLEVERQEVAKLKESQVHLELNLARMKELLEIEKEKHQATEQTSLDSIRRAAELQVELEQGKLVIEKSRGDYARLTSNNTDLQQRLLEAQEKEQRLLCVLQGD